MEQSRIRNFCIIAHIDHGKSTLADRFLEMTKTVEDRKMRMQYLDSMELERERGITIKLQPVRMVYRAGGGEEASGAKSGGEEFVLNLIDTPGHVDFSYEVSRSLAACEGALLVVDAAQGIQAQTLANLYLALEADLTIIPVINKIDLPAADVPAVSKEMVKLLGVSEEEIIKVSAKTGENVEAVLEAVVERVAPPSGAADKPLRALIFDSVFDQYRGVVAYVRVVDGEVRGGDQISFMSTEGKSEALEVGYFVPDMKKAGVVSTGEVGYIVTGFKDLDMVRVGDTVTAARKPASERLPGYREVKPVVFAAVYPSSREDFGLLADSLEKLKLSDSSLSWRSISSSALGQGFLVGFLGLLHLEITLERLKRESDLELVVTVPTVDYRVKLTSGATKSVRLAADFPEREQIESTEEPYVKIEVILPAEYLGKVMEIVQKKRGEVTATQSLEEGRVMITASIPLASMVVNFYDQLKSATRGYASMNYELSGYREADLAKVEFLVAGDKVEALSVIVHQDEADRAARRILKKLKETIPPQQFEVALQAVIGGKIIARETLSALRKDVTAKLYGGDVTRKRKLLEKQKAGKKKMKAGGRVDIPPEAFLKVFK